MTTQLEGQRTTPTGVPPHSIEAEESVLGAVMLSAEAASVALEQLRAEDFYRPSHQSVFEAVMAHLDTLGPMFVEPVSVGIFVKTTGSFIQLRTKTKWVALSFRVPQRITHDRIARKPVEYGGGWHHVVNLRTADDVDDQVRDWLTEAYEFSLRRG